MVPLSIVNQAIRDIRLVCLDTIPGLRVGDAIRFPDGHIERVSCIHATGTHRVQTTNLNRGSWYLGVGSCSFSGSLNYGIPHEAIHDTGEILPDARVWFFSNGEVKAHNGVEASIPVRMFEYRPEVES